MMVTLTTDVLAFGRIPISRSCIDALMNERQCSQPSHRLASGLQIKPTVNDGGVFFLDALAGSRITWRSATAPDDDANDRVPNLPGGHSQTALAAFLALLDVVLHLGHTGKLGRRPLPEGMGRTRSIIVRVRNCLLIESLNPSDALNDKVPPVGFTVDLQGRMIESNSEMRSSDRQGPGSAEPQDDSRGGRIGYAADWDGTADVHDGVELRRTECRARQYGRPRSI